MKALPLALASLLLMAAADPASAGNPLEDAERLTWDAWEILDEAIDYSILMQGCGALDPLCKLACDILNLQAVVQSPLYVILGCI